MKNRRYYIIEDDIIQTFEQFNKDEILKAIYQYLTDNKDALITLEKEPSEHEKKKYADNDILGYYANNPKNGKPSRIVSKGDREYFKAL